MSYVRGSGSGTYQTDYEKNNFLLDNNGSYLWSINIDFGRVK